jgi:hypothetical protein
VVSLPDRLDELRAFVSHVAHSRIDLEPLEHFGQLALVKHYLLGALLGRGRVQPFPRQVWCQHYEPPVVDVHLPPALALGHKIGDLHCSEPILG